MHKLKNVLLLTVIVQFSLISTALLNIDSKYSTREDIARNNLSNGSYESTTENEYDAQPNGLVKYETDSLVWSSYNNPINKPLFNNCYLHENVVDKLNKYKRSQNFRVLNCYVSMKARNYILNNLSKDFIKSEYGSIKQVEQYLEIDRSSGRLVEIELLDKNGNKLNTSNKYMNYESNTNWNMKGFNIYSNRPWLWEG